MAFIARVNMLLSDHETAGLTSHNLDYAPVNDSAEVRPKQQVIIQIADTKALIHGAVSTENL